MEGVLQSKSGWTRKKAKSLPVESGLPSHQALNDARQRRELEGAVNALDLAYRPKFLRC
jgi:hypothetical protein